MKQERLTWVEAARRLAERFGAPVFAGGDGQLTIEEIVLALQAIIDGAEGRDLTAEEVTSYTELEGRLASARRSDEIRQRMNAYTTPLVTSGAGGRPAGAGTSNAAEKLDEPSQAFDHYVRTGATSRLLVASSVAASRLVTSAQSEGIASAGGYLVPDEYAAEIVKRIVEYGGFAAAAKTLTTSGGNPVVIAVTVDDSANLGTIVNEGGAFSVGADIVFGQVALGAYTYVSNGAGTEPVKVSWELLDDAEQDIPSLLGELLGDRIGRVQAIHWLTGDGANEPLGVLTPKTPFANVAGTTAPTYGELLSAVHALDPGYRQNASWLMSDATLAAVRGIVDGAQRPLWLPQAESGIGTLPGGSLLGFPVVVDQAMPDIAASGATKCIGFGDWRRAYTLRRVREIGLVRLNELYATTRQTGFFSWARADGTVVDASAYVVLASKA